MIYYYDGKPTRRRPRDFDTVYFDMDGTIADLYKPSDWLERLLRGDETLYKDAAPMCDLRRVEGALRKAHKAVGVVSWLAKGSNRAFDARVRRAKQVWLMRHFPAAKEVHIIRHGSHKRYAAKLPGILLDDEVRNVIEWSKGKRWAVLVEGGADVERFCTTI